MKGFIREVKDRNGMRVVAEIWVHAFPQQTEQMKVARSKLNDFISNYVGNEPHNLYMHTEVDTVSAIITFPFSWCSATNYKTIDMKIINPKEQWLHDSK